MRWSSLAAPKEFSPAHKTRGLRACTLSHTHRSLKSCTDYRCGVSQYKSVTMFILRDFNFLTASGINVIISLKIDYKKKYYIVFFCDNFFFIIISSYRMTEGTSVWSFLIKCWKYCSTTSADKNFFRYGKYSGCLAITPKHRSCTYRLPQFLYIYICIYL